jgi:hypothetical protein
MAGEATEIGRVSALLAAVAVAGIVLAGCSSSLGGLGLERPERGSVAAVQPPPVRPTALMEAAALPTPPATPAGDAAASEPGATATGLFPPPTRKS